MISFTIWISQWCDGFLTMAHHACSTLTSFLNVLMDIFWHHSIMKPHFILRFVHSLDKTTPRRVNIDYRYKIFFIFMTINLKLDVMGLPCNILFMNGFLSKIYGVIRTMKAKKCMPYQKRLVCNHFKDYRPLLVLVLNWPF